MGTPSLRDLRARAQSGRVSVSGWRPSAISCPQPWFVDPSGVPQGITANLAVYCEMEHFGSHRTYHHADGRVVTVVRPHGRRKTCHPLDIRRLLEVLAL